MNIFISWSGALSLEVAKLLKKWLKCVLQATEPWISSDDIERGALWFNDVSDSLKECNVGIVCLTKSNIDTPWILFEAGSLLKGLATNRVCTFLIDLEPKDIKPPLSHFNHTIPSRDSAYKLISTLNDRLDSAKLDTDTLETVFNTYWPQFEDDFNRILSDTDESTNSTNIRTENDILTEILYTVRSLDNRLNKLENYATVDFPIFEIDDSISQSQIRNTDKQRKAKYTSLFEEGDLVKHKFFGTGHIEDVSQFGNDNMLKVSFDDKGTKLLMQSALIEKNLMIKIDG